MKRAIAWVALVLAVWGAVAFVRSFKNPWSPANVVAPGLVQAVPLPDPSAAALHIPGCAEKGCE